MNASLQSCEYGEVNKSLGVGRIPDMEWEMQSVITNSQSFFSFLSLASFLPSVSLTLHRWDLSGLCLHMATGPVTKPLILPELSILNNLVI